jgi:hypothetical protein
LKAKVARGRIPAGEGEIRDGNASDREMELQQRRTNLAFLAAWFGENMDLKMKVYPGMCFRINKSFGKPRSRTAQAELFHQEKMAKNEGLSGYVL